MIEITNADRSRRTVVAPREEAGKSLPALADGFAKQAGRITRVSSTSAQPFVAANYDASGAFVGGRTMTAGELDALLSAAKRNGLMVTGTV